MPQNPADSLRRESVSGPRERAANDRFGDLSAHCGRTSAGKVFGNGSLEVSATGGEQRRSGSIQVPRPVPRGYRVVQRQLVRMALLVGSSLEGSRR